MVFHAVIPDVYFWSSAALRCAVLCCPRVAALPQRSPDQGEWDQFKANAPLTNGRSLQYTEEEFTEEYTTKLVDTTVTKERQEEAERLAAAIESHDAGGNVHLAEERGQVVPELAGVSEEDRYSNVLGKRVGEQGNHTMRAGKGAAVNNSGQSAANASVPAAVAPAPATTKVCSSNHSCLDSCSMGGDGNNYKNKPQT